MQAIAIAASRFCTLRSNRPQTLVRSPMISRRRRRTKVRLSSSRQSSSVTQLTASRHRRRSRSFCHHPRRSSSSFPRPNCLRRRFCCRRQFTCRFRSGSVRHVTCSPKIMLSLRTFTIEWLLIGPPIASRSPTMRAVRGRCRGRRCLGTEIGNWAAPVHNVGSSPRSMAMLALHCHLLSPSWQAVGTAPRTGSAANGRSGRNATIARRARRRQDHRERQADPPQLRGNYRPFGMTGSNGISLEEVGRSH
jgi:hypothetical protein